MFLSTLCFSPFFLAAYAWSPNQPNDPPNPCRADRLVSAAVTDAVARPGTPDADEGELRWPEVVPEEGPSLPIPLVESALPDSPQSFGAPALRSGLPLGAPPLPFEFEIMPGSPGDPTLGSEFHEDEIISGQDYYGLVEVGRPMSTPWRMNVRLYAQFPDGSAGACSGSLIDSTHVLTAGHCVYDRDRGGWATSLTCTPAYDSKRSSPFGSARMIGAMSWTRWTNRRDPVDDMAVIHLDRPVGALTGWFGYGSQSQCSVFTTPLWYLASYPGESYGGRDMHSQVGSFDGCNTEIVTCHRAFVRGQSGSCHYRISGGRFIYAVTSHNGWDWWWGWEGGATRITSTKFSDIASFIVNNTPRSADLVPLDVKADTSFGFRGSPVRGVNFLTHHNAFGYRGGNVNLSVHISRDDNISSADIRLQSQSFSHAFIGKSQTRVNLGDVEIPSWLARGTYYLGVVIDDPDANTSNNSTDGGDAWRITIY